jgi:hypothetical protein
MTRRYQKNITVSNEAANFLRDNYGKMDNRALARSIGVGYGKTLANLRVMGLYRPNAYNGIVVKMKDFFDVDSFARYYTY